MFDNVRYGKMTRHIQNIRMRTKWKMFWQWVDEGEKQAEAEKGKQKPTKKRGSRCVESKVAMPEPPLRHSINFNLLGKCCRQM